MSRKSNVKSLGSTIDREAEALVDLIVAGISTDPNNPLASKNKIRHHLLESLGAEEYRKRLPLAYKALQGDLKSHLTPKHLSAVDHEFKKVLHKILGLFEERASSFQELWEKAEAMPDCLQKLIGLSDQTMDHCYQSGVRFFEAHHYREAADIFFFLTTLNPYRFQVWIAQGLAEKQLHHFEKALRAFNMATIVNMHSVLPMIHAIECYLTLKDDQSAKDALHLALETMQEHPTKENRQFEAHINALATKSGQRRKGH